MNFVLNTDIINSGEAMFYLFLASIYFRDKRKFNPEELIATAKLNRMVTLEEGSLTLTDKGIDAVQEILLKSEFKQPITCDRFETLANVLRSLFPTGKKEGTSLMWRDSTKVIAQRLRVFTKKFGEYNDSDIINATKKYVESFNGDYKYMQVLYYFICKRYIVEGQAEDKSQLLAYIENPEEDINDNWMNDVK